MAQAFVVDASVAAKWYLVDEDDRDAALAILDGFTTGDLDLVAPDSFRTEVASAITAATLGRQPRLTPDEGRRLIARSLTVSIELVATPQLLEPAFTLVHDHGCAFYDALYLALAQRLGLPFVTADRKFHQRLGHLPDVVWLTDYPLPSMP